MCEGEGQSGGFPCDVIPARQESTHTHTHIYSYNKVAAVENVFSTCMGLKRQHAVEDTKKLTQQCSSENLHISATHVHTHAINHSLCDVNTTDTGTILLQQLYAV